MLVAKPLRKQNLEYWELSGRITVRWTLEK